MHAADGASPYQTGQTRSPAPLLEVDDVHAYYVASHVLRGLSLTAHEGQVTAVLGRNGVGKTTLVRCIMGLVPIRHGRVRAFGQDISRDRPWMRARSGIALVPQGRQVFPSLTVRENIETAGRRGHDYPLDRLMTLFPNLGKRINVLAGRLSGGEQQMLAITRALRMSPRIILMDEPSEGLAPMIVAQLGDLIIRLRANGLSIVLVEQNLPMALGVADSTYVIERGTVVFSGSAHELRDRTDVQRLHLGV